MKRNEKFIASYSGGKDSALAVYRAVKSGRVPMCLFTTYNENAGRSWFHGVPSEVLRLISESMGIPLELVRTGEGGDYARDFEQALERLRKAGAESCVFGDIDIQEHYDWCDARCRTAGIGSLFPLWNESRCELVYEFIDSGFKAVITVVDTKRMDAGFLGRTLTRELAEQIADCGADICGENGEYHTFVYDGPLFREPIRFKFGGEVRNGDYAMLPVLPE